MARTSLLLLLAVCACGSGTTAPCTVSCTSPETVIVVEALDASGKPVAGVTFTLAGQTAALTSAASADCADGGAACSSYLVDLGLRVTSATVKATAPDGTSASKVLSGSLAATQCCGNYSTLDNQRSLLVLH